MDTYTNPGLLHLSALFIDGSDSHARAGAHLRVAQHPLLGLPVAPFVIERADVSTQNMDKLKLRSEALFRDRTGAVLTPPFSMGRTDEITIDLPTGADMLAVWAEVVMDPSGTIEPVARAYLRAIGQEKAYLGKRVGMPLAFTGTGIIRITLRGVGTVVGLRWLNAYDAQKLEYQVVDVLNLPHKGGPRYAALTPWSAPCKLRRDRQSPKRRPMQDTDGAPAKAAAPAHAIANEEQRIGVFFDELAPPLNDLITAPTAQLDQVMRRELTHPDGSNIALDGSGEISIRTLGLFLQAQADPGMASWCGYKTLDRGRLDISDHRLSLYRLTGIFQNPAQETLMQSLARGEPFAALIQAARQQTGLMSTQLVEELWMNLAGPYLNQNKIKTKFDLERRNCLALGGVAVADHHSVLAPVEPPSLDAPEHKNWLPGDSIDAPRRVVETGVRDLIAGGAIAATRRQPLGTPGFHPQNSAVGTTGNLWRALILPNIPQAGPFDSSIPANGLPEAFLSDPHVGPDEFRLYVAQMDRFGRYSEWANRAGTAGPRPKPPRPTVQGSYRQPLVSSGIHQGSVTATVPLPDEDTLAPGAFPLSHARLTVTVEGAAFGAPITLPVSSLVSIFVDTQHPPRTTIPADEDRWAVQTQFDGPVLPVMATRKMEITAVWYDTAGQASVLSEPLRLTMTDPYPPAQTAIPDALLYSARPDATGKAWVERRWPDAGPATQYAVYYTDENRMRDHLRDAGTAQTLALLEVLEAEQNPAARATQLKANKALFPAHLFERLKDVTAPVGSDVELRHALSKSLRVLSGYKIVAEAAATAARPDLETVDTVFYAVPNSDPPSQPVITARQVPPAPGEPDLVVELTVTHRPGVTTAETARIRRTRSGVVDPIRNPVIGTASFGVVDPDTGLQTATFRDIGAALIAPGARLLPFVKYAYIAEAQGTPEPGSSATPDGAVAGLWGKPSAAVTLDVVPDDAPAAPAFDSQTGTPVADGIRGLVMQFTAASDLTPGSMGPWTVTVDRSLPDQPASRIIETPAEAGTTVTVPGDPYDANFTAPTGTRFRLRLIDPIGRASDPADHTV